MKRPNFTPGHGPQHFSQIVAGLQVAGGSEWPGELHGRGPGQDASPIVASTNAQIGVASCDPGARVNLNGVRELGRAGAKAAIGQCQLHGHLAWLQRRRPSNVGDGHLDQQISKRICCGHCGQHRAVGIRRRPFVSEILRIQCGVELWRFHAERDTFTGARFGRGSFPADGSGDGQRQHIKFHFI